MIGISAKRQKTRQKLNPMILAVTAHQKKEVYRGDELCKYQEYEHKADG